MTPQRLAVAVLVLAAFLQGYLASRVKSVTWDEPFHIVSGVSYLETGDITANQQHPPLLKEMSAVFMWAAGVRLPAIAAAYALTDDAPVANVVGTAMLDQYGPERTMFWARLPFLLMTAGFVVVLYLLGCRLVGRAAALGGAFLFAFDPIVLGHAYYVTTDVGFAFYTTLLMLVLWDYLQRPSWLRAMACGLALGLVLGAKFSAVVLLPVIPVLAFGASLWPVSPESSTHDGRLWPLRLSWSRLWSYAGGIALMALIAVALLQWIYLFPENPLQYLDGMKAVNADHDPNYKYYLAGEFGPGFRWYYVVALLLKEPLATLAACAVGVALVARSRSMPVLAKLFLLLPAAVLLLGYTLYSHNLGVRYVIPVLPFAHLLGGVGLAAMFQADRVWKQATGLVLCAWVGIAAAGIYPDHLAYFNEMACLLRTPSNVGLDGGSRCGPLWLDDSNIDWGQGAKQLKAWVDQHAHGRRVYVGYFGSYPPDHYGLPIASTDYQDVLAGTKPGLYAVSSEILSRAPLFGGQWLLTTRPIAVVGHAFYIYEIADRAR